LKKFFTDRILLFIVASLMVLADQLSKIVVRRQLQPGEVWDGLAGLSSFFQIVRAQNTGAAFSMGSGFNPLFIILAIIASAGIIYYYPRLGSDSKLLRTGLGFLLGGALGNLIDRVAFGNVTDFIFIRFFAVINLADVSINIGAGLFVLWILIKEIQERRQNAQPSA
jgi:signal peptidase II